MRNIKFRGKETDTLRWLYGDFAEDISQNLYYIMDKEEGNGYEVIQETIGKYTGLKDENGKEIYEGDIVRIKGETELLDIKGKVEYSETFAQYIITNTKNIVHETEALGDYENIEVIGNIYDTPELLEEKE